jgi:hypothetical protein
VTGEVVTIDVIGRKKSDPRNLVRIQVNLRVANAADFQQGIVSISDLTDPKESLKYVTPADAALGKRNIHTSILVAPGHVLFALGTTQYRNPLDAARPIIEQVAVVGRAPSVAVYKGTGR